MLSNLLHYLRSNSNTSLFPSSYSPRFLSILSPTSCPRSCSASFHPTRPSTASNVCNPTPDPTHPGKPSTTCPSPPPFMARATCKLSSFSISFLLLFSLKKDRFEQQMVRNLSDEIKAPCWNTVVKRLRRLASCPEFKCGSIQDSRLVADEVRSSTPNGGVWLLRFVGSLSAAHNINVRHIT